MSVEREAARSIAASLRGLVVMQDGPSYLNAANQIQQELARRGLLIEQGEHLAVVAELEDVPDDGKGHSGLGVEVSHPTECLHDPASCEIQVRLESYEGKPPVKRPGQYALGWDDEQPWDLAFTKATAAQKKEIASRAKVARVAEAQEIAPRRSLEGATEVTL